MCSHLPYTEASVREGARALRGGAISDDVADAPDAVAPVGRERACRREWHTWHVGRQGHRHRAPT